MTGNIFYRPTLLAAAALALLAAACTPAATATLAPTAALTVAPATPTAACTDETVWPQLNEAQPAAPAPGDEITVTASGGYVRCGDAYNESARSFALTFDGQPAGALACYVNHCQARVLVPAEAAAGEHVIAVEGGSKLNLHVSGS